MKMGSNKVLIWVRASASNVMDFGEVSDITQVRLTEADLSKCDPSVLHCYFTDLSADFPMNHEEPMQFKSDHLFPIEEFQATPQFPTQGCAGTSSSQSAWAPYCTEFVDNTFDYKSHFETYPSNHQSHFYNPVYCTQDSYHNITCVESPTREWSTQMPCTQTEHEYPSPQTPPSYGWSWQSTESPHCSSVIRPIEDPSSLMVPTTDAGLPQGEPDWPRAKKRSQKRNGRPHRTLESKDKPFVCFFPGEFKRSGGKSGKKWDTIGRGRKNQLH